MIHFQLRCEPAGHEFDGWFGSSAEFDRQNGLALVECPHCGSTAVTKAIMAPAVSRRGDSGQAGEAAAPMAMGEGQSAEMLRKLQELAREVRAQSDYVGPKFAEEARRIHFGEAEARGIYGEASAQEVKSLLDDGVPALPLPPLPEDLN
ncbi:DUF1178 family protein [Aureimonas fodinaquatilis]|uniref:DUF1178 family protein n=1 Tax=Aureimonas fodinaquatilis TaxID=2565783 RepID=A0A5B0E0Y6_9HYPH|nr:DUF1178 family protein [Aureimonas fodinaquatilis]KAA0971621.1 DUF1178 family protein [Aureimonas fodinaquatilis]